MITAAPRWSDSQADKELAVMLGMITACRRTGMTPGPRLSHVLAEWDTHRGPEATASWRPLTVGPYLRRAIEQGWL